MNGIQLTNKTNTILNSHGYCKKYCLISNRKNNTSIGTISEAIEVI